MADLFVAETPSAGAIVMATDVDGRPHWRRAGVEGRLQLHAADLTGDAVDDVLLADWRVFGVLDGRNGTVVWRAQPLISGIDASPRTSYESWMLVPNLDGDGGLDMLVEEWDGSSGTERVAALSGATGEEIWTSEFTWPPEFGWHEAGRFVRSSACALGWRACPFFDANVDLLYGQLAYARGEDNTERLVDSHHVVVDGATGEPTHHQPATPMDVTGIDGWITPDGRTASSR